MTENIEKDCTKSISWLSLSKDAQEKIISVCLTRKEINTITDRFYSMYDEDANFCSAIHESLGCKEGNLPDLIFKLELMLGASASGGIFEPIREYAKKYREIEKAAVSIAKERQFEKNLSK